MTDVPAAEAALQDRRTLRRFAAAYRGDHDPADALWWLGHPLDPAPSGRASPRRSALALNATIYSRGADARTRERYTAALARIEADEQLARAALASAVPAASGRWRVPVAAGAVAVALAAAATWLLPQQAVPPSAAAETAALRAAFAHAPPASSDLRTVVRLLRSEEGRAPRGIAAMTGVAVGPATVPLKTVGTLATGRGLRVTLACPVETRYSWLIWAAPVAYGAPRPQALTAAGRCGPRFSRTAAAVPSDLRAGALQLTVPRGAVVLYDVAVG
jgi:hypothetical protein